jgi:hypothetical protein
VLGALSDQKFEAVVADARDKVNRAVRNAVREVEIEQEREGYRARTEQGCTVEDLEALAASGFRAGVTYVDVASRFEVYSGKGKQRSADRYYDTEEVAYFKAMAPTIQALAAKDCALFYWTSGPVEEQAHDIVRTWAFTYTTIGFHWIKTNPGADDRVHVVRQPHSARRAWPAAPVRGSPASRSPCPNAGRRRQA